MTTTASSKKKKGSTPRWLAIPAPKPQLSEAEVNAKYPRMRLQVFMGIFIGYATFYLIRNNVPLVTPILTKELGFSNAAIGALSTALLLAYGFSKFFTAMISDRSNARLFLPIGLVLSGIANILLAMSGYMGEGAGAAGYGAAIASIMATIMVFNGIFQGMGWPPLGSCARELVLHQRARHEGFLVEHRSQRWWCTVWFAGCVGLLHVRQDLGSCFLVPGCYQLRSGVRGVAADS